MKGEYKIEIKCCESEELISQFKIKHIDDIPNRLRQIGQQIELYEDENYVVCHQCNEEFHINVMSIPEDLDEVFICENCIELIMSGQVKLVSPDKIQNA